jgi:hypothetical protein
MPPDVAELLEPAARALAARWGEVRLRPERIFPGSDRSRVVRAVVDGPGGLPTTVVVKATTGEGGVRERAGLELASRYALPHAVRLLAASDELPVVVLTDVGDGPTLADRLMASDASAAEAALLRWAAALGEFQARSTALGGAFTAALAELSPLGAPLLDMMGEAVAAALVTLRRDLPRLGVDLSADAQEELVGIAERMRTEGAASRQAGLVPGDTCPSNAMEVDEAIVLLDFEGAEFRHLAWEAPTSPSRGRPAGAAGACRQRCPPVPSPPGARQPSRGSAVRNTTCSFFGSSGSCTAARGTRHRGRWRRRRCRSAGRSARRAAEAGEQGAQVRHRHPPVTPDVHAAQERDPTGHGCSPRAATASSRSLNFCTLPVTVMGKSSTKRTCRGTL